MYPDHNRHFLIQTKVRTVHVHHQPIFLSFLRIPLSEHVDLDEGFVSCTFKNSIPLKIKALSWILIELHLLTLSTGCGLKNLYFPRGGFYLITQISVLTIYVFMDFNKFFGRVSPITSSSWEKNDSSRRLPEPCCSFIYFIIIYIT